MADGRRRPHGADGPPPEVDHRHVGAFRALVDWFDGAQRALPWRVAEAGRRDPYRVWVSEVMLQQTRVDQATPYFDRFIGRFPTVDALAGASVDDVLKTWEGLGYYARARNLHRAAGEVVARHEARIPDDPERFRKLAGVGAYTAAAVQSIAFGHPLPVIDGNVRRVLARVFAIEDIHEAPGRRAIDRLAAEVLDRERPGAHNEAMMELGATVCTPRRPRCPECTLRAVCAAYAMDATEAYPASVKRRPVPHVEVAVGIVADDCGRVLVQRRAEDAMLGGLWEFPGGKVAPSESPMEACRREMAEEVGLDVDVGIELASVDHAYSHFTVTLRAFLCQLRHGGTTASTIGREGQPIRWVSEAELSDLAMPRANRKILDALSQVR